MSATLAAAMMPDSYDTRVLRSFVSLSHCRVLTPTSRPDQLPRQYRADGQAQSASLLGQCRKRRVTAQIENVGYRSVC